MNRKVALLIILLGTISSVAQADSTLQAVKARGHLVCGTSTGFPGFSSPNDNNEWQGIDVDFCKAVAAAVFGDASKVKYTHLTTKERFTALQSGEIDLLSRNATKTMGRDTGLGINFAGVMYYDGQSFMVRKNAGVKDLKDLNGATICVQTGTTSELNVTDYFKAHGLKLDTKSFEQSSQVVATYDNGRCDSFTGDISTLTAYRITLKKPQDHVILPMVISKEPLSPAVRQGDDKWYDIVSWTRNCLVNAEDLGVNSKNLSAMMQSNNPNIKRLLGLSKDFGKPLGLDASWCVHVIAAVGNYGEIYDRNLGPHSRVSIDRGLNKLWKDGGLMFAAPIR